jgi:hypothetical protein
MRSNRRTPKGEALKSELFGMPSIPVSVALRQRLKSLISGTSVGSATEVKYRRYSECYAFQAARRILGALSSRLRSLGSHAVEAGSAEGTGAPNASRSE